MKVDVQYAAVDTDSSTTINLTSGFGTPSGCLIFASLATADGSASTNLGFSAGYYDGTTQKCLTGWAYSGTSGVQNERRKAIVSDRCIYLADTGTAGASPSRVLEATASFSSDTITLSHATTPSASYKIIVIAFGGTVSCNGGYVDNTSADQVDDQGFAPKALWAFGGQTTEATSPATLTSSDFYCHVGISDFTNQVSVQHMGRDSFDESSGHANTSFVYRETPNRGATGAGGLWNLAIENTTEVRFQRIGAGSEGIYFCIGGFDESVKFVDHDITANVSGSGQTGPGFQPDAAFMVGFPGASGSGTTWQTDANTGISIAAIDGDLNHDLMYWFSEDASDAPNSDSFANTAQTKVPLQSNDNTLASEVAIDSWDASGYTYTVTNYANDSYFAMLLFENESSGTDHTVSDTDTVEATETITVVAEYVRSDSATVEVAETIVVLADYIRSDSATVQATETIDIASGKEIADTATVEVSETEEIVATYVREVSESVAVAESQSIVVGKVIDESENVAAAESVSTVTNYVREFTETVQVSASETVESVESSTVEDTDTVQVTELQTFDMVPTWFDSSYLNSLEESRGLFSQEAYDFGSDGTRLVRSQIPKGFNAHSTYVNAWARSWGLDDTVTYTLKMRREADANGIGFCFASNFPNADEYYRVRCNASSSSWQVNAHPDGGTPKVLTSTSGSKTLNPTGIWVNCEVIITKLTAGVSIGIKLWEDGTSKPGSSDFTITDTEVDFYESGTITLWSSNSNSSNTNRNFWTDFTVDLNDGEGARQIPNGNELALLVITSDETDLNTAGTDSALVTAELIDQDGSTDVTTSATWSESSSGSVVSGSVGSAEYEVGAVAQGFSHVFATFNGYVSNSVVYRVNSATTPEATVTSRGITWQFADGDISEGNFINGEPYIAKTKVAIIGISPGPTTISDPSSPSGTETVRVNGSMKNPTFSNETSATIKKQGYTEQYSVGSILGPGYYDVSIDAARPGGTDVAWDNPIELEAGDSLVSSTYKTTADNPTYPAYDFTSVSVVDIMAVLTILSAAPSSPSATFRPAPYGGGNSKELLSTSDFAVAPTDFLASWTPEVNYTAFSDLEDLVEGAWIEAVPIWYSRIYHPHSNMPDYGRGIGATLSRCLLRVNTLAGGEVHADRLGLFYKLVQVGIDMDGARAAGMQWSGDGGHMSGRKPIVCWKRSLFGEVMDVSTWTAATSKVFTSTPTDPWPVFQEDQQSFRVQETSTGVYNYGQPVYSNTTVAGTDGSYGADQEGMPEIAVRAGSVYWVDPETQYGGFLWGDDETGGTDSYNANAYRFSANGSADFGEHLVLRWLVDEGYFSWSEYWWDDGTHGAAYVDYIDRQMKFTELEYPTRGVSEYFERDAGEVDPANYGDDWNSEMWDAIRPTLSDAYWGAYGDAMPTAHIPPDVPGGGSVSETATVEVSETIEIVHGFVIDVTENVSVTETDSVEATGNVDHTVSSSANVAVSETIEIVKEIFIEATETVVVTATESVSASGATQVSDTDNVQVSETIEIVSAYVLEFTETVEVTASEVASQGFVIELTETVAVAATDMRTPLVFAESVQVSETSSVLAVSANTVAVDLVGKCSSISLRGRSV